MDPVECKWVRSATLFESGDPSFAVTSLSSTRLLKNINRPSAGGVVRDQPRLLVLAFMHFFNSAAQADSVLFSIGLIRTNEVVNRRSVVISPVLRP
jgi:hypothetical protein